MAECKYNLCFVHLIIHSQFKKDFQPRTNLVKDERGDLLVDPHKIVNRWMDEFCQLLNVQGVGVLGRQRNMDSGVICVGA
jgi:hypothetical protein